MTELWRRGKAPWEAEGETRERDIEGYLRDEAKKIGAKAYKFLSPGNDGVPDRLLALPIGQAVFVELKAPGKTSKPLQLKKQQELANLSFIVFSNIDTYEKVDKVISYCRAWIERYQTEHYKLLLPKD
jgi:hypothetical protein